MEPNQKDSAVESEELKSDPASPEKYKPVTTRLHAKSAKNYIENLKSKETKFIPKNISRPFLLNSESLLHLNPVIVRKKENLRKIPTSALASCLLPKNKEETEKVQGILTMGTYDKSKLKEIRKSIITETKNNQ